MLLGETLVADFMSGASQATLGGIGNSGTAPREPTDDTSYSVSLPEGSQSVPGPNLGEGSTEPPYGGRLRPERCTDAGNTDPRPCRGTEAIAVHDLRHWSNEG